MSTIRRDSPPSSMIQTLHRDRSCLPIDIADGGLFATLVERAFASRCGLAIDLPSFGEALPSLFAEG
jgi:phosphoribosylformylglycinamidine (FGAM) synthase-like enzyme